MATRYAVPGRSPSPPLQGEAKVIRTTDSPNCTGACGWNATVINDVIVDLKPAADYPCPEYNPRGCLRGMSMTHLIYGPDRIQRPRIRSGPRGSGQWREVTWDEVLDHLAGEMTRLSENYGPESMLLFNQVVGTSYIQKGAQIRMAALLGMSFATAYDYNGDIAMGFTQTLGIDSIECETKSWGHANPTQVDFTPKPEWYFLGLYELLKLLPPQLESVGTFFIPMGMMAGMPWLDRSDSRHPAKRRWIIDIAIVTILGIGILTLKGLLS